MFEVFLRPHIRQYFFVQSPWLIIAVLGVILSASSGYGAYSLWGHQPLTILEPHNIGRETQEVSAKFFSVELGGAVVSPGVYQVEEGARWQEVLLMANGFQDSADKKYVHQQLNLARKVTDQDKLYVPFASESAHISQNVMSQSSETQVNVLRVNATTESEWDAIAGIGPARVASILAGVPYKDEADFLARSGITSSVYKEMEKKYSLIEY